MLPPLNSISKVRAGDKEKERDWEVVEEALIGMLGKDSRKKEAGE